MKSINMQIRKMLIVPSHRLVQRDALSFSDKLIRDTKNKVKKYLRYGVPYDGEIQFYGDIPLILGKGNTFIFGEYFPAFLDKTVRKNCPYPSCHGTAEATYIGRKEIEDVIKKVDAVLVSTRAGERGDLAISLSRKHNRPIAMLDFLDHESNYYAQDKMKEMFHGFIPGKHFDLFFKKDLLLGYKTDKILPLAPIPIRPSSFSFQELSKDVDIFYSGRARKDRCQGDRAETVELVQKNFSNIAVFEHEERGTFMSTYDYWNKLSRSKMALSPSGRVWDSFRHCEAALAPRTVLIAPKPFVETVGPYLEDGVNAILYDTELKEDGKYHLKTPLSLIERIKYFLGHPAESEKLADQWSGDVARGHTILARSRYIIQSMENLF